MKGIRFIEKKTIIYFQQQLIREYGGEQGIRDEGLLDSALAQPLMTMDGNYLHQDIIAMAAAYCFHLCQNHAFLDGNKRIALVAMDVFLQINGWKLTAEEKDIFIIILNLAASQISKQQLTEWLRNNTKMI